MSKLVLNVGKKFTYLLDGINKFRFHMVLETTFERSNKIVTVLYACI